MTIKIKLSQIKEAALKKDESDETIELLKNIPLIELLEKYDFNLDEIEYLIKKTDIKAEGKSENNFNYSVLLWCFHNDIKLSDEVKDYLIQNGNISNTKDLALKTILYYVLEGTDYLNEKQKDEILKKSDLNQQNIYGYTALNEYLSQNKELLSTEQLNYLIDNTDTNISGENCLTALQAVAYFKTPFLTEHQIDKLIEKQNKWNNVLQIIIQNKSYDCFTAKQLETILENTKFDVFWGNDLISTIKKIKDLPNNVMKRIEEIESHPQSTTLKFNYHHDNEDKEIVVYEEVKKIFENKFSEFQLLKLLDKVENTFENARLTDYYSCRPLTEPKPIYLRKTYLI